MPARANSASSAAVSTPRPRRSQRRRRPGPWGLALAPNGFGRFGKDLLVGNFGDGHINAYEIDTGAFRGQLKDQRGNPITISGLWALGFGNGALAGPTDTLFFTAGINEEADGLFGSITKGAG